MKETLYLDTNAWVDFVLHCRYGNSPKKRKTIKLDELNPSKFEVFISEISVIELTEKLIDEIRMEECFKESLSILEIRRADLDKRIVSKKELAKVNKEIAECIMSKNYIVGENTPSLSNKDIKNLMEMCVTYSIFFIDALHFYLADQFKCTYFISKDTQLVQKLLLFIKDAAPTHSIKVMNSKQFISNDLKKLQ